jgi:CRP-like cAMP-binding protein
VASINNLLFKSLSDEDRVLLEPHFSLSNFPQRHVFEEPGKPIRVVCFPESLVGSIVAKQGDLLIEIGLIGCEGMSGMGLVMGNAHAVHSTFVQIAGEGNVISADALRQALDQSPTMRSAFLRYFQVQMLQTAHTAIANSIGKLPQRLARWLLMAHDRVKGDELVLTHEFIGGIDVVRKLQLLLSTLPAPAKPPDAYANVAPLRNGDEVFREDNARREAAGRASLNARPAVAVDASVHR